MTQHTIAAQTALTDAATRMSTRDAQIIALSAMTPAQRVTVSHRNELSLAQLRGALPWILRCRADDLGDAFKGAPR